MTKQTYWIADETDNYGLVTGADERDRWVREGWRATEEPAASDWVYIWHADAAEPGRYPLSALRDLWGPRGWVAGPPPGGAHPATPEPLAEQPAETKPEPKPAAGGTAKKE
jgi:hypothetical protein